MESRDGKDGRYREVSTALVAGGGFATRLKPITAVVPKPLLPLGIRPVVDYVIDKLEDFEVWFLANSYYSSLQAWASSRGVKAYITPVSDTLELKGALVDTYSLMESLIGFRDILYLSGNQIFDFNLKEFVGRYQDQLLLGLYDVGDLELAKRYGVVRLEGSRVVEFIEKPEKPRGTLINTSIAVIPPSVIKLVPEFLLAGRDTFYREGSFISWLVHEKSIEVLGVELKGSWFYLDWPDSYERMWKWYLKQ